MFKTISSCALLACLVLAGAVSPAYAQRQAPAFGGTESKQTINIQLGLFLPKGAESLDLTSISSPRGDDDIFWANSEFLCTPPAALNCVFDVGAFKSFTIGGEWLLPVVNHLEVGAGIGYSSKTVPTVYRDFFDSDATEIDAKTNLRVVPLSFTARYLPLRPSSNVQPYVGGGLGVFLWHYSEEGEFIDFFGQQVFEDTFEASGTKVGPVFLGGVRYQAKRFTVGGEARYQWAKGDLGDLGQRLFTLAQFDLGWKDPNAVPTPSVPTGDPTVFLGTKIDLGGWIIQGTFGFRF